MLAKAGAELDTIPEGEEEDEEEEEEEKAIAIGSAEEASAIEHLMCHLPQNLLCVVCAKAKIKRKHKRKKIAMIEDDDIKAKKQPVKFGDHVTVYQLLRSEDDAEDTDVPVDTVAAVFLDRATKWIAVYPKSSKSAKHTIEAMKHFAGSKDRVSNFYCDNAPELITAARACQGKLSTATTGMPQTNGVAARSVRTVKEGNSCGIVQSGYSTRWWLVAGEHFCSSKNFALVDGDSSYDRRHGEGRFKGERMLFGGVRRVHAPARNQARRNG